MRDLNLSSIDFSTRASRSRSSQTVSWAHRKGIIRFFLKRFVSSDSRGKTLSLSLFLCLSRFSSFFPSVFTSSSLSISFTLAPYLRQIQDLSLIKWMKSDPIVSGKEFSRSRNCEFVLIRFARTTFDVRFVFARLCTRLSLSTDVRSRNSSIDKLVLGLALNDLSIGRLVLKYQSCLLFHLSDKNMYFNALKVQIIQGLVRQTGLIFVF